MLTATVSGSFHRHMEAITSAVHELAALSIRVLSPADPRIVAKQGEFLFVASDRIRSVKLVQDRHLDCIRAADFLWLVCPDGYVGPSASMEIGAAATTGIPIFATCPPSDSTLREYVNVVQSLEEAADWINSHPQPKRPEGILIDPKASIDRAHLILERIEVALMRPGIFDDIAQRVHGDVARLQAEIALPTCIQ